ncbi:MAG: outer membrane lipoprotein carrier protein LolA [Syntrophobacteraceae bacterium]
MTGFVRKVRCAITLFSLAAIVHLPCSADDRSQGGPSTLTTIEALERTRVKAGELKSLSGRFRQVKHSRFLTGPIESDGVFQWKPPERFRWEVREPMPFRAIANGSTILLHYPDLNRASLLRHPTGESLLGQIAGTAGDLESFKSLYHARLLPIEPGQPADTLILSLVPKSGRQDRFLKEIRVTIDPPTWLPKQVDIVEASGDKTSIWLSDLVMNGPMDEGLFQVTPPPGVQLQRLDGSERR